MSTKILCVDDDENILAGFQRNLRREFCLETALGAEQGLQAIDRNGPFAVVVVDMQMPLMNGIQFLIKVQEKFPDTVRIMLTGNADQKTASNAVNQGHIFRFLTKPCPPEELALALRAGLHQYQLITAEQELLERTLSGSVKILTDILSILDPPSFGQAQKLREYVRIFAEKSPFPEIWKLELAAMLSGIGLVTVPSRILEKSRSGRELLGQEKEIMIRVPQIGADLLSNIPRLDAVAEIVRYQNKNFDGTGFPFDSISGELIPLGARILRILHDFLFLEAQQMTKWEALGKMKKITGRYDPSILEAAAVGFGISPPSESSTEAPPEGEAPVEIVEISHKELQSGWILKSSIVALDGTLIAGAGTKVSATLLERLHNFSKLSGVKEPIRVEKK